MAISLKHAFTSPKSDGVDSTLVQPSNWNAEHVLVQASGKLLGRATAGSGVTEELGLLNGLAFSGANLTIGTIPALAATAFTLNGTLITATPAQINRLAGPLGAVPVTVTDWNNATENGYYYGASSATNSPTASEAIMGTVVALDANNVAQEVFGLTSGSVWKRQKKAGTWETIWTRYALQQVEITGNLDSIGAGQYSGYVNTATVGTSNYPSGIAPALGILNHIGTTNGGRFQLLAVTQGTKKGSIYTRMYDPGVPAWTSWIEITKAALPSSVSLSGASVNLSTTLSGVRRVVVQVIGASMAAVNDIAVRIGTGGSVETTGYVNNSVNIRPGLSTAAPSPGTTYAYGGTPASAATETFTGKWVFMLHDSATNTWMWECTLARSDGAQLQTIGTKSLGGALDTVQLYAGGSTFDAGTASYIAD